MIKINALGTQIYATDEGLEINEPSYRTDTERAAIQTAFNAGDYEVVPDPDPEPAPPEPDWQQFNSYLMANTEFDAYLDVVFAAKKSIAIALPAAYSDITLKGYDTFAQVWTAFCTYGSVSQTDRDTWANTAAGSPYNLPADFVAIVRGS